MVKEHEVGEGDADNVVEQRVAIALIELVAVLLANVIQHALVHALNVRHLHFNEIVFAAGVASAQVQVAIFEQRTIRRVIGIENINVDDDFIVFILQHGVEQTDQLAGIRFGTEDVLKGEIGARVDEFHEDSVADGFGFGKIACDGFDMVGEECNQLKRLLSTVAANIIATTRADSTTKTSNGQISQDRRVGGG